MFRQPSKRDIRQAARALRARGLSGLEAARIYAGSIADRMLRAMLLRSARSDPDLSSLPRQGLEYKVHDDLFYAAKSIKQRRRRHHR